jgi:hypothetical protein
MHEAAPAAVAGGFACVWVVIMGLTVLVGLASFALWIWMLVDCLTKETDERNNRLIWTLVIILTQIIGALIYLIVRRPQRRRELGR